MQMNCQYLCENAKGGKYISLGSKLDVMILGVKCNEEVEESIFL